MAQPALNQVWLLDCGNTWWKWARADTIDEPLRSPAGHMPQAVQPASSDTLVYLPTAAAAAAQVAALAWSGAQAALGTVIPGCPGYTTHGLDRQAGGFALSLFGSFDGHPGALVLDAGTAITADAWSIDATRPQFRGGWIIPGHQAGMAGLAAAAPALPAAAASIDQVAAVPSTDQLAVGPSFGWPAMVQSLVQQLSQDVFGQQVPIILTGGDRDRYQPGLATLTSQFISEPHLVFRGMLAWWQQFQQ